MERKKLSNFENFHLNIHKYYLDFNQRNFLASLALAFRPRTNPNPGDTGMMIET